MKVGFSRQAVADIDAILEYVTPLDAAAAVRVHDLMQQTIARIGTHPFSAQQVGDDHAMRRIPLVRYPYLIYYEVGEQTVTILRIRHGARQQPSKTTGA